MKYNRVISTAVLFLLLGTTLPAFAQKGEEEKGGGGAKPQAAQHQAQPQRAQPAQHQAQPQRAQQAQQAAARSSAQASHNARHSRKQAQQRQTTTPGAAPARPQQGTTPGAADNGTAAQRQAQPQRAQAHNGRSAAAQTPSCRQRCAITTATAATGTTATIMAAFLTPVTVPISVTATPSTWGVPR